MRYTLDITKQYRACPDAIESRLGEETVILHLKSGTYFGLDAVGTVVWEHLKSSTSATPTELCSHVRTVFPDAPDKVEVDVVPFLEQLAERGLIDEA